MNSCPFPTFLGGKPRTTALRPWLWGTTLAGSPEHSPRSNCSRQAMRGLLVTNLERGSPLRLRVGRSVVRGKQRETFRRKSLEVGTGRPSGLGRRLSIEGADKLVQPPEAAYGTLYPVPPVESLPFESLRAVSLSNRSNGQVERQNAPCVSPDPKKTNQDKAANPPLLPCTVCAMETMHGVQSYGSG